jgi:hypothetical protein
MHSADSVTLLQHPWIQKSVSDDLLGLSLKDLLLMSTDAG